MCFGADRFSSQAAERRGQTRLDAQGAGGSGADCDFAPQCNSKAGERMGTSQRLLAAVALIGLAVPTILHAAAARGTATPVSMTGTPATGKPFAATGYPDRVVLTPGADPATEMGIAWRTDMRQSRAEAELAPAIDGPNIAHFARAMTGTSADISTENGGARYHQLRLTGLKPDTPYLYRVRGADGWSEWFQFRTAAATFRPFSFLYFGDTQNEILSISARVIRQAFQATAAPALAIHAGDLVAQREEKVHDDEWGEWTAAGGHHYASIPQIPAAGNHEYVDATFADGAETRLLGPHWPLSFTLPGNGADGVKETTYSVDYQGVRFIVLDGTAAIDLGAIEAQTRWLDGLLASNPNRWTVALFHQPIFTCARPNDTAALKAAWKPIFEKRNIDLVLQGHDHCYSRLTSEAGKAASAQAQALGKTQGPVYIVSVTGAKMYGLNDRSKTQPDRVAEDTELYQRIDVEADRLVFQAFTATGRLYDGFELTRRSDGTKQIKTLPGVTGPERRCSGQTGPDGAPCVARAKD